MKALGIILTSRAVVLVEVLNDVELVEKEVLLVEVVVTVVESEVELEVDEVLVLWDVL